MGNGVSRLLGCLVPCTRDKEKGAVLFSEPLDEGLGHSFCYVRPVIDSPHAVSPSQSDRYAHESDARHDFVRSTHEVADGSCCRIKNLSETTFKSISGASVSANTSTPLTIGLHEYFNTFSNAPYDRAAAFESTPSFSAVPLQPIPRGMSYSGPILASLSGPISGHFDPGFMSGPLERERVFMSGPLERSCISGPIEVIDPSHFSAPLAGPYMTYLYRRRRSLARIVKTVSKPVRKVMARTFSKTSSTLARTQRSLVTPVRLFLFGHTTAVGKEGITIYDGPLELGHTSSEVDSKDSHNLQWAQGKAGEDRVHLVLSEEHGWLFVGIYDGFNGPDAPDFLMSNLYQAISRELQGLLWGQKEECGFNQNPSQWEENQRLDKNSSLCTIQDPHTEASGVTGKEGVSEPVTNIRSLPNESHSEVKEPAYSDAELSVSQNWANGTVDLNDHIEQEPNEMAGCIKFIREKELQNGDCEGFNKYDTASCFGTCQHRPLTSESASNPDLPLKAGISVTGALCQDMEHDRQSRTVSRDECTRDGSDAECENNGLSEKARHKKDISDQETENLKSGKHRIVWKGRSFLRHRLRQLHSRKKENHRKMFPCRCDCEQDLKEAEKKLDEQLKQEHDRYSAVDHSAILEALSRALEATEVAYLEMADQALEENPELALMGSCVLVMLMKDEDVYVMNVGDSRAILAQHLSPNAPRSRSSCHENTLVDKLDRIGGQDPLMRSELERIVEETPTELEAFEASHNTSNVGPPARGLSLSALQLSVDHSTSIEEEVLRIMAEHPDDDFSIFKDRVKGQLKVTRAFGAGFLKKPRWNNCLLEMFRVDYVGTAPYISCTPALHHHTLNSNDRFLVLSSDGLYQYLSNEEVVHHVERFMENYPDGDPAQHLVEELLFRAAKNAGMDFHELLDIPQGDRRKYHDDVSVMVISLEGRLWRSSS